MVSKESAAIRSLQVELIATDEGEYSNTLSHSLTHRGDQAESLENYQVYNLTGGDL